MQSVQITFKNDERFHATLRYFKLLYVCSFSVEATKRLLKLIQRYCTGIGIKLNTLTTLKVIGHSPWGFLEPILQIFLLGEIGRQLYKYGAPGSRYQSIFYLTRPIHGEIDHHTGNYVPYSFRQVHGFFNVPC